MAGIAHQYGVYCKITFPEMFQYSCTRDSLRMNGRNHFAQDFTLTGHNIRLRSAGLHKLHSLAFGQNHSHSKCETFYRDARSPFPREQEGARRGHAPHHSCTAARLQRRFFQSQEKGRESSTKIRPIQSCCTKSLPAAYGSYMGYDMPTWV